MGNAYICSSQPNSSTRKNTCFIACTSKKTNTGTRSRKYGVQVHTTPCEFCKKAVDIQVYSHHTKMCDNNPINIRTPCEFCNEKWPSDLLAKHSIYCPQNPENMKLTCSHCRRQIRMKYYEDHLQQCQVLFENCLQPEQECPICLCEIKNNDAVRSLGCLHKYHEKCIADWSKQRKNCPLCRTDIP